MVESNEQKDDDEHDCKIPSAKSCFKGHHDIWGRIQKITGMNLFMVTEVHNKFHAQGLYLKNRIAEFDSR